MPTKRSHTECCRTCRWWKYFNAPQGRAIGVCSSKPKDIDAPDVRTYADQYCKEWEWEGKR